MNDTTNYRPRPLLVKEEGEGGGCDAYPPINRWAMIGRPTGFIARRLHLTNESMAICQLIKTYANERLQLL